MRYFCRVLLCALLVLSNPVLADDISNGSYSTTDGSNNASPPNGWPAGMFPNQVEPSARANMGATKRWWERANPSLATTGSGGAYVITPTNASFPTAYTQGEIMCAKANFASVGGDTLNYNGLGAKPLYKPGPAAPISIGVNDITIGQQFCASYDGALNSGAGGFQTISGLTAGPQAFSKNITIPGAGGNFLSISTPIGSSGGCQLRIATSTTGGSVDGYAGNIASWFVAVGNYAGSPTYGISGTTEAQNSINFGTLNVSTALQATTAGASVQLIVVVSVTGSQAGIITGSNFSYDVKCFGNGSIIPTPLI